MLFERIKDKYLLFRRMRINVIRVDLNKKNKKNNNNSSMLKKRNKKKLLKKV